MHQNKHQNKKFQHHQPVLLSETLEYLDPRPGESYLDLTAGYGGHASAVVERVGSLTNVCLVDRDPGAIKVLQEKFNGADIRQLDFLSASRELLSLGKQFDLILADLGVSSPHLNEGKRGFAINKVGPLDMRMDQSQSLTAEVVVNTYKEEKLINILREYGEEPKAVAMARKIISSRPLKTTEDLAAVARAVWPGHRNIHPATKLFQAVRIEVNDELGQLEQALPLWIDLLRPGGRLAIISFHSLEDRLVKQALAGASDVHSYDAELTLLTQHPISATPNEVVHNPRARSAKLRAAVKIKKKGN